MRLCFTFLIIIISKFAVSQNKEIVIKTKKLLLNQRNIDLFVSHQDIGLHQENHQINSIFFGRIKIRDYSEDSICFKIQGYVSIQVNGINNLPNEKVIITNIPFTKYNPIDSIYTYSVKYYNKDSLDLSTEKTTSFTPNNSLKFDNKSTQITINNKLFSPSIISIPYSGDSWYCTPGKLSVNQYIKKVDKFYLFKIDPL